MSPVAIALWSLVLKPGEEPLEFIPQSDLRITNIALGDVLADPSGRTSIKLTYQTPVKLDSDDEDNEDAPDPISTTVLGSLTPGKIEQATVDIVLEEDEEYLFEVVGKNTVYLTGNYIDQVGPDRVPFNSDSEDEMDLDEDAYDLRDVSSDVEIDADELELDGGSDADRFEEIDEKVEGKNLKRPRESDAMETENLSKSQQKKLNKKIKTEGGSAVVVGAEGEEKKSKKNKKDKKVKTQVDGDEKEKKPATVKTHPSGIKIVDETIGTGPQAKKGNMVSMRYIGKLSDGFIFDKNTNGKPLKFHLGKGEVIKGWDIGVAGMQVGGTRLLTIPPALAYGNQKSGPIPPGSTLIFEVKLIDIK